MLALQWDTAQTGSLPSRGRQFRVGGRKPTKEQTNNYKHEKFCEPNMPSVAETIASWRVGGEASHRG